MVSWNNLFQCILLQWSRKQSIDNEVLQAAEDLTLLIVAAHLLH